MTIQAEFPLFQKLHEFLRTEERKTNVPLKQVYISFDLRDEFVKWCHENRVFYNVVTGPAGERGVQFDGTNLIPSNQLRGSEMWVKVGDFIAE